MSPVGDFDYEFGWRVDSMLVQQKTVCLSGTPNGSKWLWDASRSIFRNVEICLTNNESHLWKCHLHQLCHGRMPEEVDMEPCCRPDLVVPQWIKTETSRITVRPKMLDG